MAVEISDKQYSTCKEANGQFCSIYTPFQPLATLPSCITALYSKNTTSILPLDAHHRLEKLTQLAYPHQLPLMYGLSHQHHLQE